MAFVIGMVIGGAVGFFTAAMLHAASDADDQMDAWVSITAQSKDGGRE